MTEPIALRYATHGKADDVLTAEPLSYPKPGAGEVAIRLLAAAIHPSDLGMIGGVYGRLRKLPATAGREGVGEIIALGNGVEGWKIGQRVRMPEDRGTWQSVTLAKTDELLAVPSDLPVEQAAMAFINPPTALRLLEDFVELEPGDWIIQNAGNSAVSQCVIQLARERGLRTLNVVRDERWEAPLKALGADIVVTESSDYFKRIDELTASARPRLALNSIGGESVGRLLRCLGDDATLVTFGGMTGEPIRFPTRQLIFNNLRLAGFWMDRWNRQASQQARTQLFETVYAAIRKGKLHCPVDATYPLFEYKNALARAEQGGRNGKVLFKVD